ncbi:hypothetical protein KY290_025155 [Solanum tuberosum]|uniref:Uncharacterized protein n=1 Tax=Solanum tuberosum TaxID=4113 RepID=A0ABQ7UVX0_SOLTU|nr:hypothetical protein KY290_025155 [Solanum tuberosum]
MEDGAAWPTRKKTSSLLINFTPPFVFYRGRGFFEDKSIIEGLEAGSLTQQFLLLPMGAFTSKGAWNRGGGWDSI